MKQSKVGVFIPSVEPLRLAGDYVSSETDRAV